MFGRKHRSRRGQSKTAETAYDREWQRTIAEEFAERPGIIDWLREQFAKEQSTAPDPTPEDNGSPYAEIEVSVGQPWTTDGLELGYGLASDRAKYAAGHEDGRLARLGESLVLEFDPDSVACWKLLATRHRANAEYHRTAGNPYQHGFFTAVAERCEAKAAELTDAVDKEASDAENREGTPVGGDVDGVTFRAGQGRLAGVRAVFTGGTSEQRWDAGEALGRYSDGHHFVTAEVAAALAPIFGHEGGYKRPIGDLLADTVQRLAELTEIEFGLMGIIIGGTQDERAEMGEQLEWVRENGASIHPLETTISTLQSRLEHAIEKEVDYRVRISNLQGVVDEFQAPTEGAEDSGLLHLPDGRETLVAAEHVAILEARIAELEAKNHRQARIIAGNYAPADVVVTEVPKAHPQTAQLERRLAEARSALSDLRRSEHAMRIEASDAQLAKRKAEQQRTKVAAKAYKRGYERGERRGKAAGARAARAQMSVAAPKMVMPEMSVKQSADVEKYLDGPRTDRLVTAVSAFWGDPLTLTYTPVETGDGKMRGVPLNVAIVDEEQTWTEAILAAYRGTEIDEQRPETD
jgi:hypothetical protein